MSEPTPAHLDLDALADVVAGSPDRTGHLAGCPSCTSRLAELTAAEQRVTAALTGLPAPAVPDDVARRLTAALAAEPALSRDPDTRAAAVTALPTRTARHRWLPAAAAAAVLTVTAGGLGLTFLPGSGGGDEASVAAGAGAGAPELPASASGTDYADAAAAAQALPRVLDGTAGPAAFSLDSAARSSGEAAGSSGGGADQAQAERETSTELSAGNDPTLTGPAPAAAGAGVDELARLRTPDGLADCLSALLPPDEPDVQPLALDYAQHQGQPALAVLLPDPDPEKVAVFVVGPGCTSQDENLLTFLRLDAP